MGEWKDRTKKNDEMELEGSRRSEVTDSSSSQRQRREANEPRKERASYAGMRHSGAFTTPHDRHDAISWQATTTEKARKTDTKKKARTRQEWTQEDLAYWAVGHLPVANNTEPNSSSSNNSRN